MNEPHDLQRHDTLPTLHDLVAPIFRYRLAGLASAGLVIGLTLVLVWAIPRQYEAEMKLLVKRERADPIVSAEAGSATARQATVSEDELNSEVEVLKGHELLEQVAATALPAAGPHASPVARAEAVRALQKALHVTPLRKTTLIEVTYASRDPRVAAAVLETLARLYLAKHLALHRPSGAYQFFSDQAQHFRAELTAAEARLSEYGRQEQVVSAGTEKESTLRQLADFEAQWQQTQTAIADADRRIAVLEQQTATTPERETTDVRTSENATLTGELRSKILELEIRRADLQRKFAPTYPPLVETEGQLAQAQAALARSQQSPLREETSGRNPVHQWLGSELARVRTDRSAAAARASAIARSVDAYRDKARQLDEKGTVQEDLKRAIATASENYALYLKKQEEARISDALDQTRIANVVIAEPPAVPALPSSSGRGLLLVVGLLMSGLVGLTVVYLLAYLNPYVQTADDVVESLGIPVLASFPVRD